MSKIYLTIEIWKIVRNKFRVKNNDTRTTPHFTPFSSVFILDFEQANVCRVSNKNTLAGPANCKKATRKIKEN